MTPAPSYGAECDAYKPQPGDQDDPSLAELGSLNQEKYLPDPDR